MSSSTGSGPLCRLTIIWGLQPKGPGHWSSGWLYDPQDGVTYDVTAELTAPNTIRARLSRYPGFGPHRNRDAQSAAQFRRALLIRHTSVCALSAVQEQINLPSDQCAGPGGKRNHYRYCQAHR